MLIKTFSILVSSILLIGSSGLMMRAHYCQNQLQSISIYLKPQSCHKNTSHQCTVATKKCCKIKKPVKKDNCCHDVKDFIKLNLDLCLLKNLFVDKKLDFNHTIIDPYQNLISDFSKKKIRFFNYKPPLIKINYQQLLQTFLC